MNNFKNKETTAMSNNYVMSKINFKNIYEKRITYAIIDSVSPFLRNIITEKKKGKEINYQKGMFNIDEITYRAKDLEPNRQHYPLLRKALKDLREKSINIETNEKFICTSIVLKWSFEKNSENINITVDKELIEFLQDITKGFALFQIKTAMSLSNSYSMKIYELLCSWRGKKKFYISLEDIRFITNTTDKYVQVGDFKKRVIELAQKDLKNNKETDLVFKYKDVKRGRNIIGFEIFPIKTKNAFEEQNIQNDVSFRWFLSKELSNALTEQGVLLKGQTLDIIKKWSNKVHNNNDNDMIYQIRKYVEAAERKFGEGENYAAYIMNCIKKDVGI